MPPFFSNDVIAKELCKYGTLKSQITADSSYGADEDLKHVTTSTRNVLMSFENNAKLPDKITVDSGVYKCIITAQVGRQKCFACNDFKHKSSDCPKKKNKAKVSGSVSQNKQHQPSTTQTPKPGEGEGDDDIDDVFESESEGMDVTPEDTGIGDSNQHINDNNKRIRLTSPPKKDWKFNEWRDLTVGRLNRKRNNGIHSFLCKIPMNELENANIASYLKPQPKHQTYMFNMLEELRAALPTRHADLKQDIKKITDKIKPLLINNDETSNM